MTNTPNQNGGFTTNDKNAASGDAGNEHGTQLERDKSAYKKSPDAGKQPSNDVPKRDE